MFCSLIRSIRDKIALWTGWAHSGIKKIVASTLHIYSLICCCLKYYFHWTSTFWPTNPTAPLLRNSRCFLCLPCTSLVFLFLSHQGSSLSESEDSQDSSDSIGSSQKARGILARRPSYRYGCDTLGVFIWNHNNSLFPWFLIFCSTHGCLLSLETRGEFCSCWTSWAVIAMRKLWLH